MLDRVDAGRHRDLGAAGLLRAHGDPAADRVYGLHDRGHHVERDGLVVDTPVGDQFRPAAALRLCGRHRGQVGVVGTATATLEELAVLRDPRPGMHGARHVQVLPEPRRRVTGQPGRADHRDTGRDVVVQLFG
ncbi:MAG TPA: hypothetical protein VGJ28_27630 [Micromonosporaceae bacterium]